MQNLKKEDKNYRIVSTNLLLREFEQDDIPALRGIQERIAKNPSNLNFLTMPTSDSSFEYGQRLVATRKNPSRKAISLTIVKGTDLMRRAIGRISLNIVSEDKAGKNNVGDLGYFLDPEFQGEGIINEASRAIIHLLGFEKIGFSKIDATADPKNTASIAVLERLGFERTDEEPFPKYGGWRVHYVLTRENFYEKDSKMDVSKQVKDNPAFQLTIMPRRTDNATSVREILSEIDEHIERIGFGNTTTEEQNSRKKSFEEQLADSRRSETTSTKPKYFSR